MADNNKKNCANFSNIVRHCAVFNCLSVQINKNRNNIKFHSFPKDNKLSSVWLKNSGRLDLRAKYSLSSSKKLYHSSYKLCDLHFEANQFVNNLRCKLKTNAIPTIFPDQAKYKIKMENKVLKEEEMKSEIFVIQGIKFEDDEKKSENEVKEETGFDEEDFWPEENVNLDDGNELGSFSEENFQISNGIDAQITRISNTYSMNAIKIQIEHENVKNTEFGSSVNNDNYWHVNSKVNKNYFKACESSGVNSILASCGENVGASNHRKSIYEKLMSYQCNDCKCCFDCKYKLENHAALIHGEEKPFKCTECAYSFSNKGVLTRHFQSVHRKKKLHKCSECDYSSYVKGSLPQHISTLHGKEKPLKCSECNYFCSQNLNLIRHVKSVHRKAKAFKCAECGYSFTEKGVLLVHIRSVHMKLKPFKCTECNSSFNWKGGLSSHICTAHRKLMPFKCIECDYYCKCKESLKTHIISVHAKEYPFSSSIRETLAGHVIAVRTKEMTFKCTECEYSCCLKKSLTHHARHRHKKIS